MHRAAHSSVTMVGHRLFIRYIVKIEQIANRAEQRHTWGSAGRCGSRTSNRTTASFCIQAAHAPVVTADTSFVNPFLHTKLRKNKKERSGIDCTPGNDSIGIDRSIHVPFFALRATRTL